MTSAVYRQQSIVTPAALQKDPENSLLSYAPRFRLEAEVLRDLIVSASGVLSLKKGGPPVRPLQPPGITEVAFGRPGWTVSEGEDRYRRSVYTLIKRTAPFAMITTFDGPSGESCIARRNRSNSPLQALTLLNDLMFVDLARVAARQVTAEMQEPAATNSDNPPTSTPGGGGSGDLTHRRMSHLFRRLLTRAPNQTELIQLVSFYEQQSTHFRANPVEAAAILGETLTDDQRRQPQVMQQMGDTASWMCVARALFGLDEVQMRP